MSIKKNHWLKLDRNFFKRHDVRIIRNMPEGDSVILFYMILLTESIDHDGYLRVNEYVPYDPQSLAIITETDVATVEMAIQILLRFDLIEIMDDETYFMTKLEKMIGNTDSSTERVRKHREKMAMEKALELSNGDVTLHETNVTDTEIDKEIDKEIDTEIDIKKEKKTAYFKNPEVNSLFLEFLKLRKTLKAKNSERAITLLLNELNKYPDDVKIQMINNATVHSWKSVYPLRGPTGKTNQEPPYEFKQTEEDRI